MNCSTLGPPLAYRWRVRLWRAKDRDHDGLAGRGTDIGELDIVVLDWTQDEAAVTAAVENTDLPRAGLLIVDRQALCQVTTTKWVNA